MTLVELEYPKIERIEGDDRYAKFACEPLPPGYGTTLGNSLRRVLLSSLEGAAIPTTAIQIVANEARVRFDMTSTSSKDARHPSRVRPEGRHAWHGPSGDASGC